MYILQNKDKSYRVGEFCCPPCFKQKHFGKLTPFKTTRGLSIHIKKNHSITSDGFTNEDYKKIKILAKEYLIDNQGVSFIQYCFDWGCLY